MQSNNTIYVSVDQQITKVRCNTPIVSRSRKYLSINVKFSPDWNGLKRTIVLRHLDGNNRFDIDLRFDVTSRNVITPDEDIYLKKSGEWFINAIGENEKGLVIISRQEKFDVLPSLEELNDNEKGN